MCLQLLSWGEKIDIEDNPLRSFYFPTAIFTWLRVIFIIVHSTGEGYASLKSFKVQNQLLPIQLAKSQGGGVVIKSTPERNNLEWSSRESLTYAI